MNTQKGNLPQRPSDVTKLTHPGSPQQLPHNEPPTPALTRLCDVDPSELKQRFPPAPATGGVQQLLQAREAFWSATEYTELSPDPKTTSREPAWRSNFTEACQQVYTAVPNDRPVRESAKLIRSIHPERAQANVNPVHVALATQPAVAEGLLLQEEADALIRITQIGIETDEFRDLAGPPLDLRCGPDPDADDCDLLLNFYFEQAALGRVMIFPPEAAALLDLNPEIVLSPSFVNHVLGKKSRAILNLSSTENGVNKRLIDTVEADPDGYATIVDLARMILVFVVKMVLHPELFDITDIEELQLLIIVMDGDAAFFRFPVEASSVGQQATRVAGYTIIPLCCTFGWRRSAEIFSHITAAISKMHASDLDSARFLTAFHQIHTTSASATLAALLRDRNPKHSHASIGHVDDFSAIELILGRRPQASAADLALAIKVMLGADGISAKKFVASSFWSEFQKIIGAWFDVSTFTVTMPHDKILDVLDLLNSPDFQPDQTTFEISACASLRGKMRWAGYATPIGDIPALINIERQRRTNETGSRRVKPWRHFGESEEMALTKFHNDLLVRKVFFSAAALNPRLASASLLSVLPMRERLTIPGQATNLAWISGDFSCEGQSFGFECDHPHKIRLWSFIPHPPEIMVMLRKTLAGNADANGNIIMSSVLERQNKLFAEFQWPDRLTGRPTICLDDNSGSVACMESGYARNPAMQAMQLLSGLRQARSEARMMAAYCNTLNMSIFDAVSRPTEYPNYVARMNAELPPDEQWIYEEPNDTVKALSNWLIDALSATLPMLREILEGIQWDKSIPTMPCQTLDLQAMAEPPSNSWQNRITAAAHPIPHTWPGGWMGSFGPAAYRVDHIPTANTTPKSGHRRSTMPQLVQTQRELTQDPTGSYSMFDAYHGGMGATLAAMQAGIRIVAGAEIMRFEIELFELITGAISLGDVNLLEHNRLPRCHIWTTCSQCQDFSSLGNNRAPVGLLGARGAEFPHQFRIAAAAKAPVIVWENVPGILTLQSGQAITELRNDATRLGYGRNFYYKEVIFAEHGEPENRVRVVGVAFADSIKLTAPFEFPTPQSTGACAGDFLLASTHIPHKCWETRPWTSRPWQSGAHPHLRTLGFCNPKDTVGSFHKRSRVWHMLGTCPTALASGNTQLVLALRLRALCPLYTCFTLWMAPIFRRSGRSPAKGGLQPRRITATEAVAMRGLPLGYPTAPETDVFRCIGGSVPGRYLTRLYESVVLALAAANVPTSLCANPNAYESALTFQIFVSTPSHHTLTLTVSDRDSVDLVHSMIKDRTGLPISDQSLRHSTKHLRKDTTLADYNISANATLHMTVKARGGADAELAQRIRKGFNIFENQPRHKLCNTPIQHREWEAMRAKQLSSALGTYAEKSKDAIRLGTAHWRFFCARAGLPRHLRVDTKAGIRAATAQAELFILYEQALFNIKGASACQKLWAVSQDHLQARLPDPFEGNSIIDDFKHDAVKQDAPAIPKIPVTEKIIRLLENSLNLQDRRAFTLATGIRFALSFCCRISEWAFAEDHSVKWWMLSFFREDGSRLQLTSWEQVRDVYELEAVFMSDKVHRIGNGQARSIFAMSDLTSDQCVVRRVAKLWLMSNRDENSSVFSWDDGTLGVKRQQVNRILKTAGIAAGIPAADISSHSLRIGGLCLLMAHGMPYEDAKAFGRWSSDCVRRYFWPSTTLARGFADLIWSPTRFTRVRGGGAVQRI